MGFELPWNSIVQSAAVEIGEGFANRAIPENSEELAEFGREAISTARTAANVRGIMSGDSGAISGALAGAVIGRGIDALGPAGLGVTAIRSGASGYGGTNDGWRIAVEALHARGDVPGFSIEHATIGGQDYTVYTDATDTANLLASPRYSAALETIGSGGDVGSVDWVALGTEMIENSRFRIYDDEGRDVTQDVIRNISSETDPAAQMRQIIALSEAIAPASTEVGRYVFDHDGGIAAGAAAYNSQLQAAPENSEIREAIRSEARQEFEPPAPPPAAPAPS